MNRLTRWDEYGNADIIALDDMMPEIYAELDFSETNALTEKDTRAKRRSQNGWISATEFTAAPTVGCRAGGRTRQSRAKCSTTTAAPAELK